jgi:hypothetical protein
VSRRWNTKGVQEHTVIIVISQRVIRQITREDEEEEEREGKGDDGARVDVKIASLSFLFFLLCLLLNVSGTPHSTNTPSAAVTRRSTSVAIV